MNSDTIYINGKTYTSLKEAVADVNAASIYTVRDRIKRGWSIEEAVNTPPKAGRKNNIIINGITYQSILQACKAIGVVTPCVAYCRIQKGWSQEEAVTTPSTSKKRLKDADIIKAANELHMSYSGFRKRLDKGMSLEEAKKVQRLGIVYDHLNNEYRSPQERAKKYGIPSRVISQRLRTGWELEKALTTPLRYNAKKRHYDNAHNKYANAFISACGLKARVTEYRILTDSTVTWEDGTVVEHADLRNLTSLQHPTLKANNYRLVMGTFQGFKTKFITKTKRNAYFECECQRCNYKDILTPYQMMDHRKNCT